MKNINHYTKDITAEVQKEKQDNSIKMKEDITTLHAVNEFEKYTKRHRIAEITRKIAFVLTIASFVLSLFFPFLSAIWFVFQIIGWTGVLVQFICMVMKNIFSRKAEKWGSQFKQSGANYVAFYR